MHQWCIGFRRNFYGAGLWHIFCGLQWLSSFSSPMASHRPYAIWVPWTIRFSIVYSWEFSRLFLHRCQILLPPKQSLPFYFFNLLFYFESLLTPFKVHQGRTGCSRHPCWRKKRAARRKHLTILCRKPPFHVNYIKPRPLLSHNAFSLICPIRDFRQDRNKKICKRTYLNMPLGIWIFSRRGGFQTRPYHFIFYLNVCLTSPFP